MKRFALLVLAFLGAAVTGQSTDKVKCNRAILKQLSNGKLFSDTLNLNGKYLNELGKYDMCTNGRNDTKFFLNLYKSRDNVTTPNGTIINPF
jgi:hypothetical protein